MPVRATRHRAGPASGHKRRRGHHSKTREEEWRDLMGRYRSLVGGVALAAASAVVLAACSSGGGGGNGGNSSPTSKSTNAQGSDKNVSPAYNAATVGFVNKTD